MLVVKGNYGWSTPCHTKDMGGNEMTCWMSVQFKKGEEPNEEKPNIKVNDFFMSCYNSKDGIKPKMVIMSYSVIVKEDTPKAKESIDVSPDELPFY